MELCAPSVSLADPKSPAIIIAIKIGKRRSTKIKVDNPKNVPTIAPIPIMCMLIFHFKLMITAIVTDAAAPRIIR